MNVCANLLETLPVAAHSGQAEGAAEYPALQELLITGNRLNDKCALSLAALPHLRQLHLAYNHLATFPARFVNIIQLLDDHFGWLSEFLHSEKVIGLKFPVR